MLRTGGAVPQLASSNARPAVPQMARCRTRIAIPPVVALPAELSMADASRRGGAITGHSNLTRFGLRRIVTARRNAPFARRVRYAQRAAHDRREPRAVT